MFYTKAHIFCPLYEQTSDFLYYRWRAPTQVSSKRILKLHGLEHPDRSEFPCNIRISMWAIRSGRRTEV